MTLTDQQIIAIGKRHFREGHNPKAIPNFVAAVRECLASSSTASVRFDISCTESDERTWLRIKNSTGSEAVLSCRTNNENGETVASQVVKQFANASVSEPDKSQQKPKGMVGCGKCDDDPALCAWHQQCQYPDNSQAVALSAEQEREAFEEWVCAENIDRKFSNVDEYADADVQRDWEVWQARAALSTPASKESKC